MEFSITVIISIILSLVILIAVAGGLYTRNGKGIGWQYIRYNVIVITTPMIGILMLAGKVDSDIGLTVIASALAYSFGKSASKDDR